MKKRSFDVAVIGAGPGGYVAAIRAAQIGKKVAIVERDRLGGVCLNWGCIPTKALLRAADQYAFLQEAEEWGFEVGKVGVRWDKVIAKSRGAAGRLSKGVSFLMKKNRIEVFSGTGRFLSPNRIAVEGDDEPVEISTTHAIVATGARPATLPGIAPDGDRIITSKEAMILSEMPKRLTVIGAGAVGLEFAYFYAVFGCEVDLLEYCPTLLPGGDQEICDALARAFKKRGVRSHTSCKVLGVSRTDDGVETRFERDGQKSIRSDAALVAVGIQANVEGLGLEDIGVATERGFVRVDDQCQTSVAGVYAIGDVRGPPALAHVASAEGLHVVDHLAGNRPKPFDYSNIPACIYCSPQVASVGMTEAEARDAGHEVQVGKFPFTANGKAVAVGETEGFVKIIADREAGELLGAHIIGPEATELIGELTLARSAELTIHDIHHAIHAHPTLSESVMEAAADWAGMATQM